MNEFLTRRFIGPARRLAAFPSSVKNFFLTPPSSASSKPFLSFLDEFNRYWVRPSSPPTHLDKPSSTAHRPSRSLSPRRADSADDIPPAYTAQSPRNTEDLFLSTKLTLSWLFNANSIFFRDAHFLPSRRRGKLYYRRRRRHPSVFETDLYHALPSRGLAHRLLRTGRTVWYETYGANYLFLRDVAPHLLLSNFSKIGLLARLFSDSAVYPFYALTSTTFSLRSSTNEAERPPRYEALRVLLPSFRTSYRRRMLFAQISGKKALSSLDRASLRLFIPNFLDVDAPKSLPTLNERYLSFPALLRASKETSCSSLTEIFSRSAAFSSASAEEVSLAGVLRGNAGRRPLTNYYLSLSSRCPSPYKPLSSSFILKSFSYYDVNFTFRLHASFSPPVHLSALVNFGIGQPSLPYAPPSLHYPRLFLALSTLFSPSTHPSTHPSYSLINTYFYNFISLFCITPIFYKLLTLSYAPVSPFFAYYGVCHSSSSSRSKYHSLVLLKFLLRNVVTLRKLSLLVSDLAIAFTHLISASARHLALLFFLRNLTRSLLYPSAISFSRSPYFTSLPTSLILLPILSQLAFPSLRYKPAFIAGYASRARELSILRAELHYVWLVLRTMTKPKFGLHVFNSPASSTFSDQKRAVAVLKSLILDISHAPFVTPSEYQDLRSSMLGRLRPVLLWMISSLVAAYPLYLDGLRDRNPPPPLKGRLIYTRNAIWKTLPKAARLLNLLHRDFFSPRGLTSLNKRVGRWVRRRLIADDFQFLKKIVPFMKGMAVLSHPSEPFNPTLDRCVAYCRTRFKPTSTHRGVPHSDSLATFILSPLARSFLVSVAPIYSSYTTNDSALVPFSFCRSSNAPIRSIPLISSATRTAAPLLHVFPTLARLRSFTLLRYFVSSHLFGSLMNIFVAPSTLFSRPSGMRLPFFNLSSLSASRACPFTLPAISHSADVSLLFYPSLVLRIFSAVFFSYCLDERAAAPTKLLSLLWNRKDFNFPMHYLQILKIRANPSKIYARTYASFHEEELSGEDLISNEHANYFNNRPSYFKPYGYDNPWAPDYPFDPSLETFYESDYLLSQSKDWEATGSFSATLLSSLPRPSASLQAYSLSPPFLLKLFSSAHFFTFLSDVFASTEPSYLYPPTFSTLFSYRYTHPSLPLYSRQLLSAYRSVGASLPIFFFLKSPGQASLVLDDFLSRPCQLSAGLVPPIYFSSSPAHLLSGIFGPSTPTPPLPAFSSFDFSQRYGLLRFARLGLAQAHHDFFAFASHVQSADLHAHFSRIFWYPKHFDSRLPREPGQPLPKRRYRRHFDDYFFDRIALQFLSLNNTFFPDSFSSALGSTPDLLESRFFISDQFQSSSFFNFLDNAFVHLSHLRDPAPSAAQPYSYFVSLPSCLFTYDFRSTTSAQPSLCLSLSLLKPRASISSFGRRNSSLVFFYFLAA